MDISGQNELRSLVAQSASAPRWCWRSRLAVGHRLPPGRVRDQFGQLGHLRLHFVAAIIAEPTRPQRPPPSRLSSTRRLTAQPQLRNARAHTMVGNRHRAPTQKDRHDHRPPHRRHPDCAGCIGNVRDSHSQYRDESGLVWTNLDKPGHLHRQFSAQSTLFCPLRPIFPSNRPIRLNCPRRLYTASHDALCAWGSRTAGYRPRRARGLMRGRRP